MKNMLLFTTVLVALTAAPYLSAAAATGVAAGHIAHHENCHYATELFLVTTSQVADRVPDHYRIRSDDGQTVLFAVQEFDCENVTAGEAIGRVRGAQVGVEICAPELAEPRCQEDKRFDFYTLYFGTDSDTYSEWLRAGTDFDVTYASDLAFDYARRDPGLALFFFRSTSPPYPWAFDVEGAVATQTSFSEPLVGEDRVENWWQDTKGPEGKQWTVQLEYPSHDDFFAPADVRVTTEDGSELAIILGTTDAKPVLSLSNVIKTLDVRKTVTRE